MTTRQACTPPLQLQQLVIRLKLTEQGMFEGRRERDTREVSFSLRPHEVAFFPQGPFQLQTDDGYRFEASVGGNAGEGPPATTLRSSPATRFGEWLKDRKHAQVGDVVDVVARPDGSFRFLHHPCVPWVSTPPPSAA